MRGNPGQISRAFPAGEAGGKTITKVQRIALLNLWSQVAKDRGWKVSDREARLRVCGEVLGRPLGSLNEVGRMDDCTRLMHGLKAMLGTDVQAGLEAEDIWVNRGRVIRHQILEEIIPCLELYREDVRAYITRIAEDKNRWWKIDRPAREISLMDLDAHPVVRVGKDGLPREFASPLEQMRFTLASRLDALRRQAGDTVHDMRTRAGVACACKACRKAG